MKSLDFNQADGRCQCRPERGHPIGKNRPSNRKKIGLYIYIYIYYGMKICLLNLLSALSALFNPAGFKSNNSRRSQRDPGPPPGELWLAGRRNRPAATCNVTYSTDSEIRTHDGKLVFSRSLYFS